MMYHEFKEAKIYQEIDCSLTKQEYSHKFAGLKFSDCIGKGLNWFQTVAD